MIWLKNGEEIVQEIGKGDILPKGDGSYWTWGSIELDPQSGDLYSCPCRLWPLRGSLGPPGLRRVVAVAVCQSEEKAEQETWHTFQNQWFSHSLASQLLYP